MDYSENYSFCIQNSMQAWYFNNTNTQATLHPFVVYYKSSVESKLQVSSFCVNSDSLEHVASTVYLFQRKFLEIIK